DLGVPAHSGEDDEPIDLDSDPVEDMRDDAEGEWRGSLSRRRMRGNPLWRERRVTLSGMILRRSLRAAHEEASVERETLVSQEMFGEDDES
ncbi:hypothetical protein KI387_008125, partial [Taxus chinensis]